MKRNQKGGKIVNDFFTDRNLNLLRGHEQEKFSEYPTNISESRGLKSVDSLIV